MIRYNCTECQRTLLVKPTLAGQRSTCPCGTAFTVPQIAKATATTVATITKPTVTNPAPAKPKPPRLAKARESNSLLVSCSKCDRQLRSPSSAAGKAVRCPCGQLVMVPVQNKPETQPGTKPETQRGTTVVSVVRTEPGGDWLNQLPPQQVLHAPPSQEGAEFWYVDAEQEDYEPPPPVIVPDARQLTHEYIRGAEKELQEQRKRGGSGALGTAQVTLILVGLLSIGLNGFLLFNAPNEVQEVMKSGDVAMSQEALLQFVQIFYGAFMAVGAVMLLLGALIYQFPVFCPLAGLILYILAIIVSGILDPMSLLKGIIIKILVIVALGKAVGDGASYRG